MTHQMEVDFDILGTRWSVAVAELPGVEVGQMRLGFMDATMQEITINQDLNPSWHPYILLHEILHALSFLGHLQFLRKADNPYQDDEAKVDAIASLLADVLTRNNLMNCAALNGEPNAPKPRKVRYALFRNARCDVSTEVNNDKCIENNKECT